MRYRAFGRTSLIILGLLLASWGTMRTLVAHGVGGTTTRISISSEGTQSNAKSGSAVLAPDGRFVSFSSQASNLVPEDTNGYEDVFIHDRQTGHTIRASVNGQGSEGNGFSGGTALSADGRYVAFGSEATNLVPNDTNGVLDVFVHDRQTGATTRVSVASDGVQGNGLSGGPAITPDGRYVAFSSVADNLVVEDTNGWEDIFVHDRLTGQTSLVSVASDGTQGNFHSGYASISADGRVVSFASQATTFVPGDNSFMDIFVHDRATGQTRKVSVASDGTPAEFGSDWLNSLSADGRYVAFSSISSNLVPDDTNYFCPVGGSPTANCPDIFLHDLLTGQTTRVSNASDGTQGNDLSAAPHLSADGRFVAFVSAASNLVPGDTNSQPDIFRHDRLTGETIRVSVASDGTQANDYAAYSDISGDGQVVVFQSDATNLVPGDTNGFTDVFAHTVSSPTAVTGSALHAAPAPRAPWAALLFVGGALALALGRRRG